MGTTKPTPATGWMQDPGKGGLQAEPQVGVKGGGAYHSVKSKSEEHQEKDDGPEWREGQPR